MQTWKHAELIAADKVQTDFDGAAGVKKKKKNAMLDSGYNLIKHISSKFLSLAIALPFLPLRFTAAFQFVCTYTAGKKKEQWGGCDGFIQSAVEAMKALRGL